MQCRLEEPRIGIEATYPVVSKGVQEQLTERRRQPVGGGVAGAQVGVQILLRAAWRDPTQRITPSPSVAKREHIGCRPQEGRLAIEQSLIARRGSAGRANVRKQGFGSR